MLHSALFTLMIDQELHLLSSLMDFHSPPIPLMFVGFLIILVMVFKKRNKDKTKNPPSKLPPGPWKLPIIGNMHQLIGPLPHHTLSDLAKQHGPFMHLRLGEVSTIVITSPRFVKEIMKTHDLNFSDRPQILSAKIIAYGCTDIAFSPYGHYWRQLRKICTLQLLSAKRVESFRCVREEELSNLIRSISDAANSPIDLSEKLCSLNNNIIARAAFGKKCNDQKRFLSAMRETLKLVGGFSITDCFPSSRLVEMISGLKVQCERVHEKLDAIVDDIIEDHKQRSINKVNSEGGSDQADFVDVLLSLQQEGDLEFPITTDNMKAIILDMFSGGTETSSTIVEWSMSELMRHPRVMEKAQAEVRRVYGEKAKMDENNTSELNYLKLVLKETLRLHPPLPLLVPRECRETCEIEGYEIPAKTRIIVNVWAMGRDPQQWEDPESFKPERFEDSSIDFKGTNFEFIPFGAGRRICPGMTFGVTNALVPLSELLYNFDWKLPNNMEPHDLDMAEDFGLTVRRSSNLYLLPIPHFPSSRKKNV